MQTKKHAQEPEPEIQPTSCTQNEGPFADHRMRTILDHNSKTLNDHYKFKNMDQISGPFSAS